MVYITGDMHGEYARFEDKKLKKLSEKDTLIICGDFGFLWNGSAEERKILRQIGSKKYTVLFLDGLHENFDLLSDCEETELFGGKVGHVYGRLFHLKRGEVYNIEGKKYFVFGGGCDNEKDKEIRIASGKWWESETPSMEEMRYAVKRLEENENIVDYILTHQPPSSYGMSAGKKYASAPFGFFLEEIFKNINYTRWFFGSLHKDGKAGEKGISVFTSIVPVQPAVKKFHLRNNRQ